MIEDTTIQFSMKDQGQKKQNEAIILEVISGLIKTGVTPLFGRVFADKRHSLSPAAAQEAWNELLRKGNIVIKRADCAVEEPSVGIGVVSKKCLRCPQIA